MGEVTCFDRLKLMDPLNEQLRQAQAGDKTAFGELVKALYPKVFRVLYGLLKDEEEARELTQQTWVKVWSKLDTFRGEASFSTWVLRIGTHATWDYLRKKKRQAEVEYQEESSGAEPAALAGVEHPEASPALQLERSEVRARFNEALETLSEKHRTALVLREIEGLSYAEIAQMMECNPGTVMSRIFHARKSIQSLMKDLL